MLQVARLAPNLLQEAADRVAEFIGTQFHEDGGAKDRAGNSDLYYSVFALDALIALRREPPLDRVRPWLEAFGDGEGLDFIHQTCLARCWAAAGKAATPTSENLARRIRNDHVGSMYHDFLRVGALEDLGEAAAPGTEILRHQSKDGSFGGTTPTTAAGVALLQHLGHDVPGNAVDWLLARARPGGGFVAVPEAPMPDLLSTATALHALSAAKRPIGALREPMLDFVDTLWTGKGFCGTWADDSVDVEYTFYGLLALGHLSLA